MIDANILIDLSRGEVLLYLFELPIQPEAPSVVLDVMLQPDREALLQLGMIQSTLTTEQLLEAAGLSTGDSRLSLGDWAALISARDEDIALLTGDLRLRNKAREIGLTVHGVLWVLDEIEDAGLLAGPVLAASLSKMLDAGARLPAEACSRRIRRWTDTS